MDLVYVSGHKNPDTDSICAAISYSYLLNATHKYGQAVPVRLGESKAVKLSSIKIEI